MTSGVLSIWHLGRCYITRFGHTPSCLQVIKSATKRDSAAASKSGCPAQFPQSTAAHFST